MACWTLLHLVAQETRAHRRPSYTTAAFKLTMLVWRKQEVMLRPCSAMVLFRLIHNHQLLEPALRYFAVTAFWLCRCPLCLCLRCQKLGLRLQQLLQWAPRLVPAESHAVVVTAAALGVIAETLALVAIAGQILLEGLAEQLATFQLVVKKKTALQRMDLCRWFGQAHRQRGALAPT